jgi:hypothetical protein
MKLLHCISLKNYITFKILLSFKYIKHHFKSILQSVKEINKLATNSSYLKTIRTRRSEIKEMENL